MSTKVESNLLSCGSVSKKLWKLTTGRRHMTIAQRTECIELYTQGALIKQLAYRYDRHRTVITRLIRRAGVKRGHVLRKNIGSSAPWMMQH